MNNLQYMLMPVLIGILLAVVGLIHHPCWFIPALCIAILGPPFIHDCFIKVSWSSRHPMDGMQIHEGLMKFFKVLAGGKADD